MKPLKKVATDCAVRFLNGRALMFAAGEVVDPDRVVTEHGGEPVSIASLVGKYLVDRDDAEVSAQPSPSFVTSLDGEDE